MWPHSLQRTVFAVVVFLSTWYGEEFMDGGWGWWFGRQMAGVPVQYVAFGAAAVLAGLFVVRTQPLALYRPLRAVGLWWWVVLATLIVLISLGNAVARFVPEPFVDWRNWVVMAVAAVMAARLLKDRPWQRFVLTDMAITYGVLSAISLIVWAAGGGDSQLGLRVPVFSGWDLTLAGFGGFVAIDLWMTGLERYRAGYAMALRVTAVSTSLLIILSFRRSVWLFFLTGLIVIAFRAVRRRRLTVTKTWKLLAAAAVVTAVVLVSFGGEVVAARVASINPAADNEFTATNADHVNDIKDALAVIGENPVFGFGTGTFYETDRIANWKESSFEVHNAVLHVWLKFGLLGLITYLGFHYRLIRTLLRYDDHVIAGFGAAGVFFLAEQVEMLMQTWAYGSIHLSIHHGIVIGVLLAAAALRGRAFGGEEGVAVPERGAAGHAAGSRLAAGGDFAQ